MEGATSSLTRSLSLALRPRRRSHHNLPTLSPAPRVLPLRRARSDAHDLLGSMATAAAAATSSAATVLPRPRTLDRDNDCLFAGPGNGNGNNDNRSGNGGGGGGNGGGSGQSAGMGEHYRRALSLDPSNPLLLRNYGKFLHDVQRDLPGAQDCYARAMLASPADADLLSLYGRALWEAGQGHGQADRDGSKDRAEGYFQRAVQAAPDDCHVLASYASFLWDAEEDDVEDQVACGSPASFVPAC